MNLREQYPDFFRVAQGLVSGNCKLSDKGSHEDFGMDKIEGANLEESNVVTSWFGLGNHKIAIDLDMDAVLIPTSTPGHHHLIIDKELSWDEYKTVLKALTDVGLVQEGFYRAAEIRGATVLRTPWTKKEKKKSE